MRCFDRGVMAAVGRWERQCASFDILVAGLLLALSHTGAAAPSAEVGNCSAEEPKPIHGHLLLQIQRRAWQLEKCGFATTPVCGKPARHNCHNKASLIGRGLCPTECEYLAFDPYFLCASTCVAKGRCSDVGPQATLDDPASSTCKSGHIPGCQLYADAKTPGQTRLCAQCVDMFILTADGSCQFAMYGHRWFFMGILFVAATILICVLPVVIYRMMLPKGNPEILRMGWDHRSRCLASERGHSDPSRRWRPWPLATNMHETLVAGSGLCIYYNNLVFVGVAAGICLLFTFVLRLQAMPDWVDAQTSGSCTISSRFLTQKAAADMEDYHGFLMGGMLTLWLLLLGLSVWHAGRQHKAFQTLDQKSSLMSDFGIQATGFPPDAFEEEIEAYFNMIAPGSLVGVSLAYNYHAQHAFVEDLLDRHLQDVDLAWWTGRGSASETHKIPERQEHAQNVTNVLQSLHGSGTAFVVLKSESDRVQLEGAWAVRRPLFRQRFAIQLAPVYGEPQTYMWQNFGISWRTRLYNGLRETGLVILQCFALALFIYAPAAHYILNREYVTGSEEGDSVTMVLGLLIAIVNGILFIVVDMGSRRVGFRWKGNVDCCNLIGCVSIVMFNTLFNLGINAYAFSRAHQRFKVDSDSESAVRDVLFRMLLAENLWKVLVPGVLLVPFILYPIYKHLLSLRAFLAYWVSLPFWPIYSRRDLRSNPNVKLREVEKGLEPEPMQIEFDYANNICVTGTAFILFFFETSYMPAVCAVIIVWSCVTYYAQKYCHLRCDQLVDYTTPMLHDCVSYLWALPISMVAAASAYWASAAGYAGGGLAFAAFFTALFLHWVLLFFVLQSTSWSSDESTEDYRAVKKKLRADFFNTNPVHVLKTQYLGEGHPLVFFQRGKEYLQPKSSRKAALSSHAASDTSSSPAESVHDVAAGPPAEKHLVGSQDGPRHSIDRLRRLLSG